MAITITRRERSVGNAARVLLWLAIWMFAALLLITLLLIGLGRRLSTLMVRPRTRMAMNRHTDSARLTLSALIIFSGPVPA